MSNYEVMTDTKKQYESNPELIKAVKSSIERQFMVSHEENTGLPITKNSITQYICSGKRSFEAAKAYKGQKTAVLNFANNRSIGGNPFYIVEFALATNDNVSNSEFAPKEMM